jgi:hypothetical protein
MAINLTKEEAMKKIDLRKKELITICEEKGPVLTQKARVAVVMDYSGSMRQMFRDGTVQNVLERLLPIAMQFDDNGEMEVWLFENGYRRMPAMTLNNFYGYVEREILNKGYHMGGTEYAPVMNDVGKKYINEDPAQMPNYIIFITDGNNSDATATKTAITKWSKYPIFWQFVGIGKEKFAFLTRLDNLDGRYVDNANFFALDDIERVADSVLYQRLLNEYPGWLALPEVQKMIRSQSTNRGFFKGLFSR